MRGSIGKAAPAVLLCLTLLLTAVGCTTRRQMQAEVCPYPLEAELGEERMAELEAQPQITPPRVDITILPGEGTLTKDSYSKVLIGVSDCREEYAVERALAEVKIRGNSTAMEPKRPYRIKFATPTGMLGLNGGAECRNWVLLADYYDATLMRNYTALNLARALLGDTVYVSDATHVRVYINGAYQGIYLLCEHTQIHESRVSITQHVKGDPRLDTGYLLASQGGRTDDPDAFGVNVNMTVTDALGGQAHYDTLNFTLSGGDYTPEQTAYIARYVASAFRLVWEAVYRGEYYTLTREGELVPKTHFDGTTEREKQRETIEAAINLEAAVGMLVLEEIVKDLDSGVMNIAVDLGPQGDGRLTLTAPWDYDFSMANTKYPALHTPEGLYATYLTVTADVRVSPLLVMLCGADWFREEVVALWQESLPQLEAAVEEMLTLSYSYKNAFYQNYVRWPLLGKKLKGHQCGACVRDYHTQQDAALDLYAFLTARLAWLDSEWGG